MNDFHDKLEAARGKALARCQTYGIVKPATINLEACMPSLSNQALVSSRSEACCVGGLRANPKSKRCF